MTADTPDPNSSDPQKADSPSETNPAKEDAATLDAMFGEQLSEEEPAGELPEVEQLKKQLADAEKRVLIAHADLDNYRKRARREREDDLKYAAVPLLIELLPVIDNLQRAIQAVPESEQSSGIVQGVKMVEKQLHDAISRRGVEVIQAEGQPFDPNHHEAILQQPSADAPPGTVLQQTQVGYRLHDRVIRPSQVIVSSAPAES
ncbi:MAG: nucleotide exchange factor GrpE [Pirellulaceae bacterium]